MVHSPPQSASCPHGACFHLSAPTCILPVTPHSTTFKGESLENIGTGSVSDALDVADKVYWTEQPPRSAPQRLRFLVAHHGDLVSVAAHLPAATEELLLGILERKQQASTELRQEIALEVARRWQIDVRRTAHKGVVAREGRITVSFRAWLGYDPPSVRDGDGRHRMGLHHLLPHDTALLLEARGRNADDSVLENIIGAGIGEVYFRVPRNGREKIYFCNIDFVEFAYDDIPANVSA